MDDAQHNLSEKLNLITQKNSNDLRLSTYQSFNKNYQYYCTYRHKFFVSVSNFLKIRGKLN